MKLSMLFGVLAIFVHFGLFVRAIPGAILMFVCALLSSLLAYKGRDTAKSRNVGSLVLGTSFVILVCSVALLALEFFSIEPRSMRVVTSNEARAAQTLYLLAKANVAYAIHNNHYVSSLDELEQSEILQSAQEPDINLAKEVITKGTAAGYGFTYSKRSNTGFQIIASPQVLGKTGNHFLYMDQSLRLHWDLNKPADSQSPTPE